MEAEEFMEAEGFVVDTSVLSRFVCEGYAELLYQIVGQIWIPPSIISPDPSEHGPELNSILKEYPSTPRSKHVRAYLDKKGELWDVMEPTDEEQALASKYTQTGYRYIKRKRGDAEGLALAKSRRLVLLTDDGGVRTLAHREGIIVLGTCGILLCGVSRKVLGCEEARQVYENIRGCRLKDIELLCHPKPSCLDRRKGAGPKEVSPG
jgi:hypothetical protein